MTPTCSLRLTSWKYSKIESTSSWTRCPSPSLRNKSLLEDLVLRGVCLCVCGRRLCPLTFTNSMIPHKMNAQELLGLFGGSEENLHYFLELKKCLTEIRSGGQATPSYDPRDKAMRARVETIQWRPRMVLRLPEDLTGLEGESYGPSSKQTALDEDRKDDEENDDIDVCDERNRLDDDGRLTTEEANSKNFVCGVQGCSKTFTSLSSYESHYHTCHNYECASCKRSFVSSFLLDLHLQENHDSYFQILCSRIDMYRCLVESCESKFRTPEQRRDHLVVHHKFPASFSFHQPLKPRSKDSSPSKSIKIQPCGDSMDIESGPREESLTVGNKTNKQQRSKKNHRRKHPTMDCDGTDENSSRESPPESMQCPDTGRRGRGRGKNVPRNICFGRGSQRAFRARGRGGQGRHWHQLGQGDKDTTVDIEQMDFKDISDALQG